MGDEDGLDMPRVHQDRRLGRTRPAGRRTGVVRGAARLGGAGRRSDVSSGEAVAARSRGATRGAIALRALIYRIFSALGEDRQAAPSDIEELNALLPEAQRQRGIVTADGGYEWGWLDDPDAPLDRVLWPIAVSAAALLTWDQLDRVKLCRADDCGWLFVDASRNRSRRWCDMSDCGNRAKARRFRTRHSGSR